MNTYHACTSVVRERERDRVKVGLSKGRPAFTLDAGREGSLARSPTERKKEERESERERERANLACTMSFEPAAIESVSF